MSCALQQLLRPCPAGSPRAWVSPGKCKAGFVSGHVGHQFLTRVPSISDLVTPEASPTEMQPKGFSIPSTSGSSRKGSSRQQRVRHANASMEQDMEPPRRKRGRPRKVKPEPETQQQEGTQAVASSTGANTVVPTIDLTMSAAVSPLPTACLVLSSSLKAYTGTGSYTALVAELDSLTSLINSMAEQTRGSEPTSQNPADTDNGGESAANHLPAAAGELQDGIARVVTLTCQSLQGHIDTYASPANLLRTLCSLHRLHSAARRLLHQFGLGTTIVAGAVEQGVSALASSAPEACLASLGAPDARQNLDTMTLALPLGDVPGYFKGLWGLCVPAATNHWSLQDITTCVPLLLDELAAAATYGEVSKADTTASSNASSTDSSANSLQLDFLAGLNGSSSPASRSLLLSDVTQDVADVWVAITLGGFDAAAACAARTLPDLLKQQEAGAAHSAGSSVGCGSQINSHTSFEHTPSSAIQQAPPAKPLPPVLASDYTAASASALAAAAALATLLASGTAYKAASAMASWRSEQANNKGSGQTTPPSTNNNSTGSVPQHLQSCPSGGSALAEASAIARALLLGAAEYNRACRAALRYQDCFVATRWGSLVHLALHGLVLQHDKESSVRSQSTTASDVIEVEGVPVARLGQYGLSVALQAPQEAVHLVHELRSLQSGWVVSGLALEVLDSALIECLCASGALMGQAGKPGLTEAGGAAGEAETPVWGSKQQPDTTLFLGGTAHKHTSASLMAMVWGKGTTSGSLANNTPGATSTRPTTKLSPGALASLLDARSALSGGQPPSPVLHTLAVDAVAHAADRVTARSSEVLASVLRRLQQATEDGIRGGVLPQAAAAGAALSGQGQSGSAQEQREREEIMHGGADAALEVIQALQALLSLELQWQQGAASAGSQNSVVGRSLGLLQNRVFMVMASLPVDLWRRPSFLARTLPSLLELGCGRLGQRAELLAVDVWLHHVTDLLNASIDSGTGSDIPAYTLTPEDLALIVTAAASYAPLHLLGDEWGTRTDRAALRMVEAAIRVGYMREDSFCSLLSALASSGWAAPLTTTALCDAAVTQPDLVGAQLQQRLRDLMPQLMSGAGAATIGDAAGATSSRNQGAVLVAQG